MGDRQATAGCGVLGEGAASPLLMPLATRGSVRSRGCKGNFAHFKHQKALLAERKSNFEM